MKRKQHWERVYTAKPLHTLGWYRAHLQISLEWILELGLEKDASIIDVGGGASTLVDDLLDAGYDSLTVVDLAATALSLAKSRLGARADSVIWIEGDITEVALPQRRYDVWHDRAVFHFLVDADERRRYIENLLQALRPGGCAIIGTFAAEAPPQCSGLPVQRYDHRQLSDVLGKEFELTRHAKTLHFTPGGVEQMYQYCRFQRLT